MTLRSISRLDLSKPAVNVMRNILESDFTNPEATSLTHFNKKNRFTFILPNLKLYHPRVEVSLVASDYMKVIKNKGIINWWLDYGIGDTLYVINNLGFGNCLMHSCSLAIWGIQDRWYSLRRLVLRFVEVHKSLLLKRFVDTQTMFYQNNGSSIEQHNLLAEWDLLYNILAVNDSFDSEMKEFMRTENPIEIHTPYLENWHIYWTAVCLGRPIIVLGSLHACKVRENIIGDIFLPGIYLPLEKDPVHCTKNPIFINYRQSQYSAMVFMNESDKYSDLHKREFFVPIQDENRFLLPVRFSYKTSNGENNELTLDEQMEKLKLYLDVVTLKSPKGEFLCSKTIGKRPELMNQLVENFLNLP